MGEDETVRRWRITLPFVQLTPECENNTAEEREGWMKEDDGYEITYKEIVAIFLNTNEIGDEATVNEPLESVSHDDAVKALEVAKAYVEKQEEAKVIKCMML